MLDDLKKDRQLGFGAQERLKLSLYVAGLLVLGGVIFVGTRGDDAPKEPEPAAVAPTAGVKATDLGPRLDPAEVRRRADADAAAPDRWASGAIEHVLDVSRRGRIGEVSQRLTADEMALLSDDVRGQVFEVAGHVTEVAGEAWAPLSDSTGNERLWTVVLEGSAGVPALAVKYGNQSDVAEGAPVDEKPPGMHAERIAPGQHVVARGVYVQRRTGSFGGTAVLKAAPVLIATSFRIVMPPDQISPVIPDLEEALWGDVQDRFNRESRKWDEDALYEVIQWARAQGYPALREAIERGELPWTAWERQRFDTWKVEVAVEEDTERPITEGSRGKLFRFSGIVGEVLDFGWATVPRNRFGVDRFQKLTLLSDHYRNVALELFLPYPLTDFPGVTGAREQHLRLYGIFIKNFTYDTQFKREDGSGRRHPATVPLFVVLHGEPFPEEEAGAAMRHAMLWVAGAMVLFALLFYVVLIRGGARQTQRMEEHRLALRKRIRAKGQGAELPRGRDEIPPEDGG